MRRRPGLWFADSPARDPNGHTYLGYTGWSAPQLRDELLRGHWRDIPTDPAFVFDPAPDSLWQRALTHKNKPSLYPYQANQFALTPPPALP